MLLADPRINAKKKYNVSYRKTSENISYVNKHDTQERCTSSKNPSRIRD